MKKQDAKNLLSDKLAEAAKAHKGEIAALFDKQDSAIQQNTSTEDAITVAAKIAALAVFEFLSDTGLIQFD